MHFGTNKSASSALKADQIATYRLPPFRVIALTYRAHGGKVVQYFEQFRPDGDVRQAAVRQYREPVGDGRDHSVVHENLFQILRRNRQ